MGLGFVASGRDIVTPIAAGAVANMSGMRGVSLVHPQLIHGGQLVHLPTNWQATSGYERAQQILECGGLLSIKAHIIKDALGFVAQDGLDKAYRDIQHELFTRLEQKFGSALWWTSMGEIASRFAAHIPVSDT
jgi:hypothetical protein